MLVILIIFSVGLLGLIIYFAVSPKSSKLLKMAASIALGLICISLLICGILLLIGPKNDPNAALVQFLSEEQGQAVTQSRNFTDIILLLVLFGILALVINRSMKEQKKMAKSIAEIKPKRQAPVEDTTAGEQVEDTTLLLDDDSFDLGID